MTTPFGVRALVHLDVVTAKRADLPARGRTPISYVVIPPVASIVSRSSQLAAIKSSAVFSKRLTVNRVRVVCNTLSYFSSLRRLPSKLKIILEYPEKCCLSEYEVFIHFRVGNSELCV